LRGISVGRHDVITLVGLVTLRAWMGLQKEDSGKDTSCGLLCNDVLCVLWVKKRSETAAKRPYPYSCSERPNCLEEKRTIQSSRRTRKIETNASQGICSHRRMIAEISLHCQWGCAAILFRGPVLMICAYTWGSGPS
jgi:hypothetical protein